jgi:8-oxo-dGTP pyrophosphatase MutT (NUDIX family)
VSRTALDRAWVAALHAGADQPPRAPRVPLWAGAACIGSVEPDYFSNAGLTPRLVRRAQRGGVAGWEVPGDLTLSLDEIAHALRRAGLAHAWRDEQLAVCDEHGMQLGTVERAVVRPLGITTLAVHLAGFAPDGRHWLQLRSITKANDPGLWDTLVGGMVPACDSIEAALARETWEEAGLQLAQLSGVERGGRVTTRRPSRDVQSGYVVEHIDWYRCIVPLGVLPVNRDGEVDEFRQMHADELAQRLERNEFTTEAALILLAAGL